MNHCRPVIPNHHDFVLRHVAEPLFTVLVDTGTLSAFFRMVERYQPSGPQVLRAQPTPRVCRHSSATAAAIYLSHFQVLASQFPQLLQPSQTTCTPPTNSSQGVHSTATPYLDYPSYSTTSLSQAARSKALQASSYRQEPLSGKSSAPFSPYLRYLACLRITTITVARVPPAGSLTPSRLGKIVHPLHPAYLTATRCCSLFRAV